MLLKLQGGENAVILLCYIDWHHNFTSVYKMNYLSVPSSVAFPGDSVVKNPPSMQKS